MDVAAMVASLDEKIAHLTRAQDLLAGLAGQSSPEPKRRTMSLEGPAKDRGGAAETLGCQ